MRHSFDLALIGCIRSLFALMFRLGLFWECPYIRGVLIRAIDWVHVSDCLRHYLDIREESRRDR